MIDIKEINVRPEMDEIRDFIRNPLFEELHRYMEREYKAIVGIEFSKDVWARGWNVKYRKSGKALCVVYPKAGCFTLLVVIGRKEKEKAEKLLPQLSEALQKKYRETKEGNGQRWLMIDLNADGSLYRDVLELIRIRRESR